MQKKCTLCNKSNDEVSLLIHGENDKCICNECIKEYNELLTQYSLPTKTNKNIVSLIKPHEMKKILDSYVIGQDEAKIALSVAMYNQQLIWTDKISCHFKNNIIIVGPTGVGKTYLVETASKVLKAPYVFCDSKMFSEVGYVGEDVNHILEMLYYAADKDLKKAENGIVFIDEIDKIRRPKDMTSNFRDVSGEGVQQSLLKMIDGAIININVKNEYGKIEEIKFNTKNILFVMCGAFVGMNLDVDLSEALIQFGMLPELVGRISTIIKLNQLTKNDYIAIMKNVNDSIIDEYINLFNVDGIDIKFMDSAIEIIAEEANTKECGARSIFSILANIMIKLRYICLKKCINEIRLDKEKILQMMDNDYSFIM